MSELDRLIEAILMEEAALTKGSQRVMNNKDMVANLADAIRDDSMSNPGSFPAGFARTARTAPDEKLAHWFLENLDRIEREGYEGTVYSRDGVNNEWITRRYIAGSHNWEDIIGILNMNMRDFYTLKNRGLLDAGHTDIPKFNSIRDLGKYLSTHYHEKLEQARDAAKQAALNKMGKTAKLVDNEDYKIYTVFNWAGARSLGLGTQWCTANSQNDHNYKYYSNRGMLFQVFPKNPEEVEKTTHPATGVTKVIKGPEKYQFDAGTPTFNDIADHVVPYETVREKFPYLYTDLVAALSQNKEKLEAAMEQMADNTDLNSTPAGKIKTYSIDDQIKQLKVMVDRGWFTTKKRPAEKPEEPEALPAPQSTNTPPDPAVMEWLERLNRLY